MPRPLQLTFLTSAKKTNTLPASTAEVAFLGRSNVGKSSLLNALANRKGLAKVSKQPGRTQMLNCFALEPTGTLVDCPGYGYAAAPGSVRSGWPKMMEHYLIEREPLVMAMVLVDGEIGPTKLDVQMLDWLREVNVPFTVIASKYDKVKPSKRANRKRDLALGCGVATNDVYWVSAAKGHGLDAVRDLVRDLTSG